MEIVPWAVVNVACQQQFCYNLVIKSGSVNATDMDSIRIRCASGECEFKDLPPSILFLEKVMSACVYCMLT